MIVITHIIVGLDKYDFSRTISDLLNSSPDYIPTTPLSITFDQHHQPLIATNTDPLQHPFVYIPQIPYLCVLFHSPSPLGNFQTRFNEKERKNTDIPPVHINLYYNLLCSTMPQPLQWLSTRLRLRSVCIYFSLPKFSLQDRARYTAERTLDASR